MQTRHRRLEPHSRSHTGADDGLRYALVRYDLMLDRPGSRQRTDLLRILAKASTAVLSASGRV